MASGLYIRHEDLARQQCAEHLVAALAIVVHGVPTPETTASALIRIGQSMLCLVKADPEMAALRAVEAVLRPIAQHEVERG